MLIEKKKKKKEQTQENTPSTYFFLLTHEYSHPTLGDEKQTGVLLLLLFTFSHTPALQWRNFHKTVT